MKAVLTRRVTEAEGIQRLDRWFKKHYPELGQIRLQKLLRTGQVRVDGKRAETSTRIHPGQDIRIPPLPDGTPAPKGVKSKMPERLIKDLLSRVLYRDEDVLVINKPAGLAVQGGTGTKVHLDGALDELRFGSSERPRLVHRLDRDTAGVIVLARTQDAARKLAESFRQHKARKYYWAVTLGVPELKRGKIDLPLLKSTGAFEKMEANEDEGDEAITYYAVVDRADRHAAWVALWPVTGRTHQLRAHMAAINAPLLGDPKYGQKDDYAVSKQLHLFARRLIMPHPRRGIIDVTAPLPEHFKPAWDHFGFQGTDDDDPFAGLDPLAERRALIAYASSFKQKKREERKKSDAPAKKTFERKDGGKRSQKRVFADKITPAEEPRRSFKPKPGASGGYKKPYARNEREAPTGKAGHSVARGASERRPPFDRKGKPLGKSSRSQPQRGRP